MDFEITDMSWPDGWLFSLSAEECNPVVIFPPGFAIITSERSAGLPVRRNRYEERTNYIRWWQPQTVLGAIMMVVKSQVKKAGYEGTTPLVKKLSFGTYNGKFAPNRTKADWLCSDEGEMDAYLADPLT